MVVLVTCKNEEDLVKNEGARVATRLYVDFQMVGSCRNLNSFEHLCMSLVPARMKKIKTNSPIMSTRGFF